MLDRALPKELNIPTVQGWQITFREINKNMKQKTKPKISKAEIKEGTNEEMEHTSKAKIARKIALDHLKVHPLYYNNKTGLPAMEKKLSKEEREKAIARKRGAFKGKR